MSGIQQQLLGGPFGVAAYQIQRSLRFNSADSAYLNRTLSAGNRKTWTWSGWVKRSAFDTFSAIFCGNGGTSDATFTEILFRSDQFQINGYNTVWRRSTAVYRDPSAWYHLVVAFDTTQATASNRVKLYVNGTQVTDFAISNDPTQNTDYGINAAVTHGIGSIVTGEYYNGYMTDVYFIDGQALTPSSFGETNADTGVWQPKQYTGTYGTNGFYLDFVGPTTVAGQLYKSSTLYTTKTDILANATAISGGASISSEYLYFVPNSNATTGTNVFTSNGSMNDTTRYFYRSGGSWVQTSGSYGTTEFTSMLYGTDSSNYRLSASRDFYLLSSSTGQAAATGTVPTLRTELIIEDQSGNNNDWAANNISTTAGTGNDSLVDTPTPYGTDTGAGGEVRGNYCTLNRIGVSPVGLATLVNGNLDASGTGGNYTGALSTFALSTGKWYFEYTLTSIGSVNGAGIINAASLASANAEGYGFAQASDGWVRISAGRVDNNGGIAVSGLSTFSANDVMNIAVDFDAGKLWFGKNGTWDSSGNPATGSNATITFTTGSKSFYFCIQGYSFPSGSYSGATNFGQRPFAYTAPSGFKALVTQNLPTPTVIQGDDYFNTVTYSGTGATQSITGVGFQPDLVWTKSRSNAYSHLNYDVLRGVTKYLSTNSTAAEGTAATSLTAFNSDGFTLGSGENSNTNGTTSVAWNWKANGAGSSNTAGTITSTVSANTTSGFSIVTYTGTGSLATVGHGLGVAPSMIIVKNRSTTTFWAVYHASLGNTQGIELNSTNAASTQTAYWNSTSPTTTLFTVNTDNRVNGSSNNMVAYCFAPVAGFSAFGSYIGNGSTDGPFVYTGFRPAFIIVKQTNTGGENWYLMDNKRSTFNLVNDTLYPNQSSAETVDNANVTCDFTSNGFKIRDSYTGWNANGGTYIYACFAENPFKYSLAR